MPSSQLPARHSLRLFLLLEVVICAAQWTRPPVVEPVADWSHKEADPLRQSGQFAFWHQQSAHGRHQLRQAGLPVSAGVPQNRVPFASGLLQQQNVNWPHSPPPSGGSTVFSSVPGRPFEEVLLRRTPFRGASDPYLRSRLAGGEIGMSRLESTSSEEERDRLSAEIEHSEQRRRELLPPPARSRGGAVHHTTDVNNPSVNNMDRYMPLLNRQRPRPKNMTTHWSLANSAEILPPPPAEQAPFGGRRRGTEALPEEEEEEDGREEQELAQTGGEMAPAGPCVSANCRTWITITIPSELVGLPGSIGTGGGAGPQQKPDGQAAAKTGQPPKGPESKKQPEVVPSVTPKPMPPFPPQPMQPLASKSRPAAKKNGAKAMQHTTPGPATVASRGPPPDFVFSTKWILPVNGISVRPSGGNVSGALVSSTAPPTGGARPALTTATAGGIQPFTMRPTGKPNTPVPPAPAQPRGRPEAGSTKQVGRPAKPWTHSGAEKATKSGGAKNRPDQPMARPEPPTPDTTIEQAAIWASTELIDAIREALAKFRATLNRRAQQQEDGALDSDDEWDGVGTEELIRAQLQSAWDSIKGTWLEQAVSDIARQADAAGGGGDVHGRMADLLLRSGLLSARPLAHEDASIGNTALRMRPSRPPPEAPCASGRAPSEDRQPPHYHRRQLSRPPLLELSHMAHPDALEFEGATGIQPIQITVTDMDENGNRGSCNSNREVDRVKGHGRSKSGVPSLHGMHFQKKSGHRRVKSGVAINPEPTPFTDISVTALTGRPMSELLGAKRQQQWTGNLLAPATRPAHSPTLKSNITVPKKRYSVWRKDSLIDHQLPQFTEMERRLRKSAPSSPRTVLAVAGLFVCGITLLISGLIVLLSQRNSEFRITGCVLLSLGFAGLAGCAIVQRKNIGKLWDDMTRDLFAVGE